MQWAKPEIKYMKEASPTGCPRICEDIFAMWCQSFSGFCITALTVFNGT